MQGERADAVSGRSFLDSGKKVIHRDSGAEVDINPFERRESL